jgi:hypothetical protein
MGRRAGSLNYKTDTVIRALATAPGDTLEVKYAHIVFDDQYPLTIRDDAARCLAGCMWARHKLTNHQEAKLASLSPDGKCPPVSDEPPKRRRRRRRPIVSENDPALKEPNQC